MNTLGGLLAVVALGPFVGGFVLDLLFGNWARWWYPHLLIGLAGVGFLIWAAVIGQPDEPGREYNWPLGFVLVFFVFPLFILLPVVMSASGVSMRRWVAPAAAREGSAPSQGGPDPG